MLAMIIDNTATRTPDNSGDLIHYPNMGIYACFLGSVITLEKQNYLGRPDFLYFQVFQLILQLLNTFFLGHTIWFLKIGWKNQKELIDATGK